MVSTTRDFTITWDNPEDAKLTWLFDPMHTPDPLTHIAAEFSHRLYERYMSARTTTANGYEYSTAPTPRPPSPEILERGVLDVWVEDYMPAVKQTCERLRAADYDSLSLEELGRAIDGIMHDAVTGFGYTMKPISAFMGPTFGLVQFLQEELGAEGPRLAATLLQGFENGTAAAGAALSRMADEALKHPAVADALRKGQFDKLDQVDGGAAFLSQLHAYLEEFGWRVDSWGIIERPTWAENPRLPLTLISRYINDPERTPEAAHRRSVQQREEALAEVEARLPEDRREQFRAMLAASQSHVPISEGRALWQLITIGSLRVPFLALGRKLVEAGALSKPEQVFFFTTAELREAAAAPGPDWKARADQRERDFESWRELTPPPFLGSPPDEGAIPPELEPLITLFFGMAPPEVKGREIKGQAASRGTVTGRARVIRGLGEAERLQPGEILVCATTAPPWTPLFAIAAAVVTDSGGVLSHSAICAREYAIPCVVATQVATQMIRDGSLITVDGTAGTVQIEAGS